MRSPHAAQRFAKAIDDALDAIEANPDRFVRVYKRDRACRVKKFPFQVIFRTSGDVLFVAAIAHAKRRPGYWTRRK